MLNIKCECINLLILLLKNVTQRLSTFPFMNNSETL